MHLPFHTLLSPSYIALQHTLSLPEQRNANKRGPDEVVVVVEDAVVRNKNPIRNKCHRNGTRSTTLHACTSRNLGGPVQFLSMLTVPLLVHAIHKPALHFHHVSKPYH